MITVSCPKCSAKLRVDPAYQGLTCRCTHCRALLAVPSDASRMPVRLASASVAGKRVSRGGTKAGSGTGTRSGSQLQDVYSGGGNTAPELGVVQPPRAAASPEPLISLESSRRGGGGNNHTAILAGAVAAGAAILVLGIVTVVLIVGRSGTPGPTAAYASSQPRSLFDTDPTPSVASAPAAPVAPRTPAPERETDNPHTWKKPTVLGQPLSPDRHTAIVVDAVEQSLGWIEDVNESLRKTLAKEGTGERVSIFYIHDGEVSAMPRQPFSPGRALRSGLLKLQRASPAAGRKGFYDGLTAAIDAEPDDILVITGRENWSAAASHIVGMLEKAPSKPTFSAISMAGRDRDLTGIAEATGGTVEPLKPETVRDWLR